MLTILEGLTMLSKTMQQVIFPVIVGNTAYVTAIIFTGNEIVSGSCLIVY